MIIITKSGNKPLIQSLFVTNVAFLKVTAFNFIQIYYDNCYEKMNESPVMPTIRDVAELACVSVATVSRVINRPHL